MIDFPSPKLKALFDEGRKLADEIATIDQKENESRRKLSDAAKQGGLDSPKVQRAIADARMILDLCEHRRPEVARLQKANLSALRSEYRRLKAQWTEAVNERAESLRAKLTEALESLGVARVAQLALSIERTQWPGMAEINRCRWDQEDSDENILQAIESFLGHVRRHAAAVFPKPEGTQLQPQ